MPAPGPAAEVPWSFWRQSDACQGATAFAPPYGNYGQDGTNDSRIPRELLAWLRDRYRVIFTQDRSFIARPGTDPPLGRLQVTRSLSGGGLHAMLNP